MKIVKTVMTGIAVLATMGIVIPWIICNPILPLWLDILCFAIVLIGWGIAVEKYVRKFKSTRLFSLFR